MCQGNRSPLFPFSATRDQWLRVQAKTKPFFIANIDMDVFVVVAERVDVILVGVLGIVANDTIWTGGLPLYPLLLSLFQLSIKAPVKSGWRINCERGGRSEMTHLLGARSDDNTTVTLTIVGGKID